MQFDHTKQAQLRRQRLRRAWASRRRVLDLVRATPPKLSVTRRNKARRRTKPIPERRPSPDTAGQPQKPITRAISLGVRRSAIAKNVPKIKSSVTKQRAFVVATLPPSRLLDSDDVSRSMERASTEKGTLIKSGYPEPMEMKQAAPNTKGSDEATKPEHADTDPDSDLLQIDSDDSVPSIDDDDLLGDWPELESDHLLSPKKDPAFGKKAGASLSGDIEAVVSSTVESADPEEKDNDTFLDDGEDFAPDDISNRGPTPRTSSDSLEGRTGRDKRRTRAHSKGIEVADEFEDPAELASRVKEGLASEIFHKKEKSTKPHGASRKTGSKVLNHSTGHRQRKESAEQKTGEDDGVERKTSDANGKKSDPWDSSLEEDEGISLGKKGLEDDLLDEEDEEAKGLEGGKRRKEGAKDDEDADETGEDEKDHTEGTKTQQPAEKKNPSQDHNDSSLKALGLTSAKLEADEGTTASAKTKHATEDLSKHRNPPGEKAGRDQKSPSEKKGKLRHWNVSRLKGKGHGMGSGHKREFALRRQEKAIQAKVLRNKLKEVEDTGSDIINDNFGAALTAPTPEAPPQQAAPSTLATETAAASASWARASDNGVGGDAGLARLLAIVFGFTVGFIILFLVAYWICIRTCRRRRERRHRHTGPRTENFAEKYSNHERSEAPRSRDSSHSFSTGSTTLQDDDEEAVRHAGNERPKHLQNIRQKLKLRSYQSLRLGRNPTQQPSKDYQADFDRFSKRQKSQHEPQCEKDGSWGDDFSLAAYRPFSALTTPSHFRPRDNSNLSNPPTPAPTPARIRPRTRSLRPIYLARLGSGDPVGRPPNVAEIPETIAEDHEREREVRYDSKTEDWVAEQSHIWKRRFSRRTPAGSVPVEVAHGHGRRPSSSGRVDEEPALTFMPSRGGKAVHASAAQSRFPIAVPTSAVAAAAAAEKNDMSVVAPWEGTSPLSSQAVGVPQLPPLNFTTHPGTRVDLDRGRERLPSDVLDACMERRRAMRP